MAEYGRQFKGVVIKMSDSTLITMSRELFKKYIDEAYQRGKEKGRAEGRAEAMQKAKNHTTAEMDGAEFKAQIVEG